MRVSIALSSVAQKYDLNVLRGYILETIGSQKNHEGQNERDREDDAGYRSIVIMASEHDKSTRSRPAGSLTHSRQVPPWLGRA